MVQNLIESGIHFGHRVGRWNPKMKPYIFCVRNSIHIINIKETMKGLLRSKKFLAHVVASGKDVLFVGTKRQARNPVIQQSQRSGMHSVSERWLGGTLTNFRTIRSRLSRLEELEAMEETGQMEAQGKKMASTLRREMKKIKRNLDGIRNMTRLPGAMVIIDPRREYIAVNEARKLGIPIIALLDTDSDPDVVDIPIPGNDDAMRAIELIVTHLTDSILEGKVVRVEEGAGPEQGEPVRRSSRRRISAAQAAEALASGQGASSPEEAPPAEGASGSDSGATV